MAADRPDARISLGQAAYRHLRTEISFCRLPPGRRLTEKQLAIDTGFGVAPLREALTRLDQEGLVRTIPRKGYQVTPLTPKSVDDIFDVWSFVGPELVRRGVASATPRQIAELRERLREFEETVRESAPETEGAPVRLIEFIHATLDAFAQVTGNDYLISLHARLSVDLTRIWTLVLAADPNALTTEFGTMWVRHIFTEPDADAAANAARAHIAAAYERVRGILLRWPSVVSAELVPVGLDPSAVADR